MGATPHGNRAEPVRRVARVLCRIDPKTGQVRSVLESQEETTLAADGCLETIVTAVQNYVCGHDPRNTPGGTCCACGGLVCAQCFTQCVRCFAPICPRHTYAAPEGRCCKSCRDALNRGRIAGAVVRGMVGLFVTRESKP